MPEHRYKHLPFDIFPDDNLIVVAAEGDLLFEDLVGHVEDFMNHDDFCSGMNIFYDLSEVSSLGGQLQTLLESAESLNCCNFIPVPAKTVFFTNNNEATGRMLEGFCIMTRYTRVPHFIASTLNEAFSILEMHNPPKWFAQLREQNGEIDR